MPASGKSAPEERHFCRKTSAPHQSPSAAKQQTLPVFYILAGFIPHCFAPPELMICVSVCLLQKCRSSGASRADLPRCRNFGVFGLTGELPNSSPLILTAITKQGTANYIMLLITILNKSAQVNQPILSAIDCTDA